MPRKAKHGTNILRKDIYLYITLTKSHRPEEVNTDSYDMSEPGLRPGSRDTGRV